MFTEGLNEVNGILRFRVVVDILRIFIIDFFSQMLEYPPYLIRYHYLTGFYAAIVFFNVIQGLFLMNSVSVSSASGAAVAGRHCTKVRMALT